ncbi:hypothetical protein [Bordetella sp. LUAb4]|uniref:OB-fold protein n=1 Tax=Bordetella sp. LUAb4 TaxID=2843195 RepID=UPI001E5E1613|nr:hypothetical protein [Bordetella sp. LUAb4]
MKNLAWIAAASLAVLPWGAHAVTFDCSKARSAPEKLICSTPDLSQADDHLKLSFEAARARATDKKAFNERAKQEWQRREKTCTDAACVRQWYADQERLYAAPAAVTPAVPAQPAAHPASPAARPAAQPATSPLTPDTRPTAAPPPAAAAPNATPGAATATAGMAAATAASTSGSTSGSTSASTSAHAAPAQATPAPAAANAPEVAATVLYSDYQQSESAADRKYKGRTIKISGTVASVTAPANGDPYIELTAADSAMPKVHLDFPKTASPRIAEVKKGQKIALPCVVQGLVIGDPVLRCADAP